MRRRVKDVMTTTVAVVTTETPFKEIARRLAEHRVAALPVIDAREHVVGVVSEADLLLKEEHPEPRLGRPFEGRRRASERRKASGALARDLMTAPAVTVGPDAPLAEAARLMHEHGYRSLPVVDATERVVGIVARRDLLRAFLRPDHEIQEEIEDQVILESLWIDPQSVTVSVEQGVVTLSGQLEPSSLIPILVRMTYGVDGVVRVENHLTADFDDTDIRPYIPAPWGVLPYGARS